MKELNLKEAYAALFEGQEVISANDIRIKEREDGQGIDLYLKDGEWFQFRNWSIGLGLNPKATFTLYKEPVKSLTFEDVFKLYQQARLKHGLGCELLEPITLNIVMDGMDIEHKIRVPRDFLFVQMAETQGWPINSLEGKE
jgi:hypothetical protein